MTGYKFDLFVAIATILWIAFAPPKHAPLQIVVHKSESVIPPRKPETLPDWRQAMLLPPKQFDRVYDGEMRITRADMETIRRDCWHRPGPILGCTSLILPHYCSVWIVDDKTLAQWGYTYDTIFRHERGHCLGWRHD